MGSLLTSLLKKKMMIQEGEGGRGRTLSEVKELVGESL
jgi:hypothetical protein